MRSVVLCCMAVALCGCENRAATGALLGAGGGALLGGVIGGGEGAAIGAAAGAVGGALIGAAIDSSDRQALESKSPETLYKIDRGQPLGINDIKQMSHAGIRDEVIISQIQATRTIFHLSTADIVDLTNSGVSQKVIQYMIETGSRK